MFCNSLFPAPKRFNYLMTTFPLFLAFFLFDAFGFGVRAQSSSLCSWYEGASADDTFCQKQACAGYCELDALPHYCMKVNYVDKGYCKQTGGFPLSYCSASITGVTPEYEYWCQTVACNHALLRCMESGATDCTSRVGEWILLDFATFCRPINAPVPTNSPTTKPSTNAISSTKRKCKSTTTSTKRTEPVTSNAPITTKAPVTTQAPVTTKATTQGGGDGNCYAPSGWSGQPCAVCPQPSGDKCVSYQWTQCYATMAECNRNTAGGGNCDKTCAVDTLSMKRPTFKGPSCYTTEYGGSFGPQWKPSGRTAFEKLIPTPTTFHAMIQTVDDDIPFLQRTWGVTGCDAATAVYENIVCALELIESLQRDFEGPKNGGSGAKITEFGNNGDKQTDLREIAAFFSHKFKETGRLQTWEEAVASPSYIDPNNAEYPPVSGQSYHGRGPVQISWNYNYGAFSEWFYKDKSVLLANPDRVDPEGPMGFIAALWFWFTPRDFTSNAPVAGSIRTRDALIHWTDNKLNSIYNDGVDYDSVAGLGLSTNVINGGIECTQGDGTSAKWRLSYFLTVASRLGVDLPNLNDASACKADKYCNGLTAGCTASAKPVKCEPKDTTCGPAYVSGWTQDLCQFS